MSSSLNCPSSTSSWRSRAGRPFNNKLEPATANSLSSLSHHHHSQHPLLPLFQFRLKTYLFSQIPHTVIHCCTPGLSSRIIRVIMFTVQRFILSSFFVIFCISFRVVDKAGYLSAFYLNVKSSYRTVSYRIVPVTESVCRGRPSTSWQKAWWGLDNSGTMYRHSVRLEGVSSSSETSSTKLYTFLSRKPRSALINDCHVEHVIAAMRMCINSPAQTWRFLHFLPGDTMHKRGLCRRAVYVCLSVRLSVTFVYFVETSKYIFKMYSPSGSHTILDFPHQALWQYIPTGDPLTLTKLAIFDQYLGERSMTARALSVE